MTQGCLYGGIAIRKRWMTLWDHSHTVCVWQIMWWFWLAMGYVWVKTWHNIVQNFWMTQIENDRLGRLLCIMCLCVMFWNALTNKGWRFWRTHLHELGQLVAYEEDQRKDEKNRHPIIISYSSLIQSLSKEMFLGLLLENYNTSLYIIYQTDFNSSDL